MPVTCAALANSRECSSSPGNPTPPPLPQDHPKKAAISPYMRKGFQLLAAGHQSLYRGLAARLCWTIPRRMLSVARRPYSQVRGQIIRMRWDVEFGRHQHWREQVLGGSAQIRGAREPARHLPQSGDHGRRAATRRGRDPTMPEAVPLSVRRHACLGAVHSIRALAAGGERARF